MMKYLLNVIRQLIEAHINDITIVVGFMKEEFDYLIEKYNVKLVVNREYQEKNNLHSLNLVKDKKVILTLYQEIFIFMKIHF